MSSKKKILILTEWYLPGRKAGGPVKSIESLVSSLSQVFDFFVLTTNKDLGDSRPYSGVQTMSWQVQKDGSCIYYLNSSNLNKRNLFNAINSISYDYLYINSLYSKWFSIIPLWWRKRNIIKGKIILAPRGMLSEGALNLKSLKKRLFLSTSKILSLHSNVKWHATYSKEVDEIKTEFGNGAKIAVAGNLSIPVKKSDLYLEKKNDELKLFFLARVSKVKNLHVALQSLSALQNIQGQIIYDVYGSIEDEDYLQYCKNIVKNYNGRIKVDFKGEILNNEISHMIQKYHFLLMPTCPPQ
ncbi:MAG: glycosyltransferase [Bacteroidota bacterium]